VQPAVAVALGQPVQAAPQRLVPRRPFEESVKQRAQVEPRPAHDERRPAPRGDLVQTGPRPPRVVRRRERLVGLHDVDQMVRNLAALVAAGLRAADVEAL
jgi:hypothetical protein